LSESKPEKISNRECALKFLRLVVARKIREAYATCVAPDMQHHNTAFAGDAMCLEKAMKESHSLHPDTVIDIKRTLEEGDLVAVHSHLRLRMEEPGFAVVHIFRFDGGRIVEMWDIVQAVPTDSPNKNGMF
jgi:predicted SnoaL-like aldol condensation-catalyzing enzyme